MKFRVNSGQMYGDFSDNTPDLQLGVNKIKNIFNKYSLAVKKALSSSLNLNGMDEVIIRELNKIKRSYAFITSGFKNNKELYEFACDILELEIRNIEYPGDISDVYDEASVYFSRELSEFIKNADEENFFKIHKKSVKKLKKIKTNKIVTNHVEFLIDTYFCYYTFNKINKDFKEAKHVCSYLIQNDLIKT